jgi:polyhydroxyalkanoate synthesis regulator phasin
MPTLSEMLVGSVLESSQKAPDLVGAVSKGAELGLHVQQVQMQRQQLEAAKQQAEQQKFEKIGSWYETAAKMPEGSVRKAFISNYIPNGIKALGVEDRFDPTAIQMLNSDPNFASFITNEIRNGRTDMSILTRPDSMAELAASPEYKQFGGLEALKGAVEEYRPKIEAAQAERIAAVEAQQRAEATATASLNKQIQGQQAAGEVEARKDIGKLWSAYKASGGEAGTRKRVEALRGAISKLQNNEIKFGTIEKKVPYGSTLDVLARTDEKAKALVDQVHSSIDIKQRTGDPNPTQAQIDAIRSQAIDPRLSNSENIKKLQAEIDKELLTDKNARSEFIAGGFLKQPATKKFSALSSSDQAAIINALMTKNGKNEAEVRKELEGK